MAAEVNYSGLDRLVHRIAFATPALQLTAADIEKTMYGKQFQHVQAERPVFVTSLPRAGTTILLEALHRLPGVATHTYRDMPFLMAPFLWSKLSKSFRKTGESKERAHGDGIEISYDSPEAFEDVIWQAFWPKHFSADGIRLWKGADANDEAQDFFVEHMRKIIALRCPEGGRYVSKNNGNIARLDLLPELFGDAAIIVPLRDPIDHAKSLLRQHQNFAGMHDDDPFAARYMSDIGHFEFGSLHRPIQFETLSQWTEGRDRDRLDYWLGYWIAAYEHVLERVDRVTILGHEATCRDPETALDRLCAEIGMGRPENLAEAASIIRGGSSRVSEPPAGTDPALVKRAQDLHRDLLAASLVQ